MNSILDKILSNSDSKSETIINYSKREREREIKTLPGGNEKFPSSSPNGTSEDKNPADARNRFAERILTGALSEKTTAQQLTDLKNSLIPHIAPDDVEFVRVSVYPADNKEYTTTGDGTLRVNASVRFCNPDKFMPLLDNNGFLQIVFKTTTRTRDFKRNIQHINYEGYQRVEQLVRDPAYKAMHFAGKGAYRGRRGSKITPPFMTHSAIGIVSETLPPEPMCLITLGHFHAEIELYPPTGDTPFIYVGDYYNV